MRGKGEHGFTLVELMVVAALLATLVVIATDAMIDVLHNRNRENLSYQLNQDAQRILDRMTRDIESAGFRFASPTALLATNGVVALDTPGANFLRMQCVTGIGQLASTANAGTITLILTPDSHLPSPGGNLLLANDGRLAYVGVNGVNHDTRQVTITGLPNTFPAGTLVAAIDRIDYRVINGELARSVNGTVQWTVPVDTDGTSISYTLRTDTDGDGNRDEGETENRNLLDTAFPTSTDLDNLLTVDITLQLRRATATTRGDRLEITQTVSQRATPLNLRTYNPDAI